MNSGRRLLHPAVLILAVVAALGALGMWWLRDSGDASGGVGGSEGIRGLEGDGRGGREGPSAVAKGSGIGTVPFSDDSDRSDKVGSQGLFLSGTVVAKDSSAPLAGAKVAVELLGKSSRVVRTVTAEDGTFRIGPMRATKFYRCVARSHGYEPTGAPKRVSLQKMADGETGDVGEIALEKAAVLKGLVVDDETGVAIVGATVAGGHQYARNETLELRTQSAADGSFSFSEYTPVHHRNLMISVEGYARHVQRLGANEVRPEQVVDLGEIRLVRGCRVFGRVVDADSQASIGGASLSLVTLNRAGPFYVRSMCEPAGVTANDGSFDLSHVPPSKLSYLLMAATSEGCGWLSIRADRETSEVPDLRVEISKGSSLQVEVVDIEGAPIPGVHVKAVPTFAPLQLYRNPNVSPLMRSAPEFQALFGATTDEAGRTTFAHLPRNADTVSYDILISKVGWSSSMVQTKLRASNELLRLNLYKGVQHLIRGRVVYEDGSPFRGAKAGMAWGDNQVITGSDGTFKVIIKGNTSGSQRIKTSAVGYVDAYSVVKLEAGKQPEPIEVVLRSAAPIAGRLIDESGQALKGVQVDIEPVDKRLAQHYMAQTDSEGKFAFQNTSAGLWNVSVIFVDDRKRWKLPLPSLNVEGGSLDVQLIMRRAKVSPIGLIAHLKDAETNEPVNAERRGSWLTNDWTDMNFPLEFEAGRVIAKGLPPGNWRLRVELEDGRALERTFVASLAQPDLTMTLRIGATGGIAGKVSFEGVDRPRMVSVMTGSKGRGVLRDGSSAGDYTPGFVPLAADNSFHFADVTPGPLIITVVGEGVHIQRQIEVPVGRVLPVELIAKPLGTLVFRGTVDPRVRAVNVWTQVGGGPWVRSEVIEDLALKAAEVKLELEAGAVNYRLQFEPESARKAMSATVQLAANTQTGVSF